MLTAVVSLTLSCARVQLQATPAILHAVSLAADFSCELLACVCELQNITIPSLQLSAPLGSAGCCPGLDSVVHVKEHLAEHFIPCKTGLASWERGILVRLDEA